MSGYLGGGGRSNPSLGGRSGSRGGYGGRSPKGRRRSGYGSSGPSTWVLLLIDLVVIAVFLLVYAYFHHVKPIDTSDVKPIELPTTQQEPTPTAGSTVTTIEPQASAGAEAEGEATEPEAAQTGHKFESRFTETPTQTENKYTDKNTSVEVMTFNSGGVTYHVADIYLREVKYLKTSFTSGEYGGASQTIQEVSSSAGAFVAINGDQYGLRKEGVIVRNGVLYRETPFMDVAVLENDGTLTTYAQADFNVETVKQNGAWQVWSFGPVLLTDGQPMEKFNASVNPANPRSAIGMIEPLHYILVTVDGRGESAGLTLKALSQLMFDLGCKTAYNLDGGDTAAMTVNGELYSTPSGERKVTDIIYVGKE